MKMETTARTLVGAMRPGRFFGLRVSSLAALLLAAGLSMHMWSAWGVWGAAWAEVLRPKALNGVLSGRSRDLRIEMVGFISPKSWIPLFRAVDVVVTARLRPRSYMAEMQVNLAGLFSWFASNDSGGHVEGYVHPNGLRVSVFSWTEDGGRSVRAEWKEDDVEIVTTFPEPKKEQKKEKEKEKEKTYPSGPFRERITAAHRLEGVDVVTATLNHFLGGSAESGLPCEGNIKIYDTLERYDIKLSFDSMGDFNDGAWKGPVFICDVKINVVAMDRDGPSGNEKWKSIKLRIADLGRGQPMAPVRLDFKGKDGRRVVFITNKISYVSPKS